MGYRNFTEYGGRDIQDRGTLEFEVKGVQNEMELVRFVLGWSKRSSTTRESTEEVQESSSDGTCDTHVIVRGRSRGGRGRSRSKSGKCQLCGLFNI